MKRAASGANASGSMNGDFQKVTGKQSARISPARKPGEVGKWEILRRLRYGELRRLYRNRWGHELPDDSSGRDDLFELVCNVSLAPSFTDKKIKNVIEVWAPWMPRDEVDLLIEHVGRLTLTERTPTARELGERMNLTNAERERLRIRTMLPVDMTDEELAERQKRRKRERDAKQRRAKGVRTREAYLEQASRPKPWEIEGISRRTYYRRLGTRSASPVALGPRSTILTVSDVHPVPSVCADSQQGLQVKGVALSRRAEELGRAERENKWCSRVNDADPVPEEHPLMAAMQNWGVNLERKKNSTISAKRKRLGWDDLSEFEAFSTDVLGCPMEALGPFARAFGPVMRAAA